jgi:hypothetical protein
VFALQEERYSLGLWELNSLAHEKMEARIKVLIEEQLTDQKRVSYYISILFLEYIPNS